MVGLQRRKLRIVRSLARGGEGTVHEAILPSGERIAYKEYHQRVLDAHGAATARKLDAMIANPPKQGLDGPHRTLAWPRQVIREGSRFVGFGMPLVSKSNCKLVELTDYSGRKSIGRAHWTWATMVALCRDLSSAVQVLHDAGAAWGDLNEENVLVDKNGRVTLIDLDTAAFRRGDEYYPGSGYTRVEWSPPSSSSSPETFTQGDDRWALAVEIYILLMESHRPYATRSNNQADSQANVQRKLFPILDNKLALPSGSPPLDVIPPPLARQFRRTFGRGFDNPEDRPTAQKYAEVLTEVLKDVRQCQAIDNHVWAPPRTTCPWCKRLGLPTSPPSSSTPAGRAKAAAAGGSTRVPPSPVPANVRRPTRPRTTVPARPIGPTTPPMPVAVPRVAAPRPSPPPRPHPRRPRRGGRLVVGLIMVLAAIIGTTALGAGDPRAGFDRVQAWADQLVHSGDGAPDTPEEQVAADRGDVEVLVDTWVPQLASIPVDQSPSAIMKQFRSLRALHPDTVLLRSDDYASFQGKDYYVIVVAQSFTSARAVNAWCRSGGYTPADCYAKRPSHKGSAEGNTVHWR